MTRAKLIWVLLAVVMSNVIIGVVGITMTLQATAESEKRSAHAVELAERRAAAALTESNRKWCRYLGKLDAAYKATPPQTKTGRDLAAENANMLKEFGCAPLPTK